MRSLCALMALLALGVPAQADEQDAQSAKAPPSAHLLGFSLGKLSLELPVSLTGRAEYVSGYELDRYGTEQAAGVALAPRARVGLRLDSKEAWTGFRLIAEYEQDVPTGTHSLRPAVDGEAMPDTEAFAFPLRKANVRAQIGERLQLGAGLMTSHWGLGLMANDGAHEWAPGTARFTDPRGGDRVLRAFVGSGPYGELGLAGVLAADLVWDDDVLLTDAEVPVGTAADSAWQVVAALTAGSPSASRSAGLYVVHRRQTAGDGRLLAVTVVDATGRVKFDLGKTTTLALEFETAFIAGTTDFAASPEDPQQPVRQFGAAVRGTLDAGSAGAVLDVLFASGDQNADDGNQNAFKADPNYEMGMFLYRHVLAAQTGRSVATAGDLDLVGVPSQGIERLPSQGSPTNTLAFFPRGFWRPIDSLEIYGGPLIALSAMPLADPLNSRVAGGDPRNATDAAPGLYLGTEVDVGIRWKLTSGAHRLTLGAEGGVLLPGSALALANGDPMPAVIGARTVLDYRF